MSDCLAAWVQSNWPTTTPGRWALGLLIGLGLGHLAVAGFFLWVRRWLGPDPRHHSYIPGWITGLIERLFFLILVSMTSAPLLIVPLMFTWSAAKIAANWGRNTATPFQGQRAAFTIRALLAGLISMLFALFGGMIAGGQAVKAVIERNLILPPF